MKSYNEIKKTYVKQLGEYNCGLACLSMIVKYHGGEVDQEQLKSKSGTTVYQGTSLLGLYQVAPTVGLIAEGFEADIENLKKIEAPVILHVLKDKSQHYLVCYGYTEGRFTIADPGWGIMQYTEEELAVIWQSKSLLMLTPSENFQTTKSTEKKKIEWFKTLIRDDVQLLAIAAFIGLITAGLGLTLSIFAQKLIDNFLPDNNIKKLVTGVIFLLILLAFRQVLDYLRMVLLWRQSRDFGNRIIRNFFTKILFLPKNFFDSMRTGELVQRMNDTLHIQTAVTFLVSGVVVDVLSLFASIIYLFYLSTICGAISAFIIFFLVPLSAFFTKNITLAQKHVMANHAKAESHFVETVQNISVVKLFGIENVFSRMSNFLYGSFQDSIYKLQLTSGKYNLLAGLSGVIVITSVIATASFEVLNNNLKIGELTAIIGLASGFIAAVSNLALTNIRLREARVAFDRMYEFAGLDPEFKEETINTELPKIDSIVLNNLSFRFPGKSKLINNINIEIKKGEIICLFGEIGCGKSTILNIISRMYSGYEGQILIDSEDWNRYSIPVWRSMIASVPQYTELFNSTVFENISFKLSSQKDIENVEKFC